MNGDKTLPAPATIAAQVNAFYESHPYPPPQDDLEAYRRSWDDGRRRADSHLFWPDEPYRDDRSVLVAGCGTTQAAHYALRWPRARVVGIDVSATSIAFTRDLKREHGLDNLELHQLAVERAPELGQRFEHVVCTGVLHHLADPDAGLRALHDALKALPPAHPLAPLLRNSPDFANVDALADALLHPQDRAYSVPQAFDFLACAELAFGRWLRQAPYLPSCGALAATPHRSKLAALTAEAQYAAIELFRGTMVRHSAIAYRRDRPAPSSRVDFGGDAWRAYRPIRLPDTVVVRERVPPGAVAVLINRNHTYTDLYLPIDARQDRLLAGVDAERTIGEICTAAGDDDVARAFFEQLWLWDQIVFDTSMREGGTSREPGETRVTKRSG